MLDDVTPYLRCPHCAGGLARIGGGLGCPLGCPRGHRFDVARQGYVSLLDARARTGTADTAAMVAARTTLLDAGHFAGIGAALAARAAEVSAPGCVADAGGGTGHHLAAVLDRCTDRVGVCCDLSRHAARRAAHAHPRIGAVVADVWAGLPLRGAGAAVLLDVFAPRNAAEFHRVLHPDGVLLVVTPQADHLAELVTPLGLLDVDGQKARRLDETLRPTFEAVGTERLRWTMRLSTDEASAVVAMGPSAWHRDPAEVATRLEAMAPSVAVTGAVTLSAYRPRRVSARPR